MRLLPMLLLFALLAACGGNDGISDDSTRDDQGTIVEGGDVGVFVLEVGDCFDDPAGDAVQVVTVEAVPCDQPHDNQVAAKFDLPDSDFPGDDEVLAQAVTGCIDRFENAVGEPYETSRLDVLPMYPTKDGWDSGDHEVICNVYNLDLSKLTSSVVS